jgi:serine/threonine protein kinase
VEGRRISHYRILRRLGAGGMGEVYAAEDERLRREVAIKFIRSGGAADESARRRFEREAQAASSLNHPNICTIFEINDYEGQPFLVMELLDGQDLRRECAAGPLEIAKVVKLGVDIADALDAAHGRGITHRDIKPANIFITNRGDAKVLDFGLAKLEAKDTQLSETLSLSVSVPGSVVGTVAYMSPEQARGEALDARTDLFSLGAVLYEMVGGKPAFDGTTPAVVFNAILTVAPSPLSRIRPDVPPKLESIIGRALEKERELRYQSAGEMKTELKRLQRELEADKVSSPPASKAMRARVPSAWLSAALVFAILASGLGWLFTKSRAKSTRALSHPVTVAVLPFQNAAADTSLDYLSTALPDEVITTLSYAPTLSVRPFSMSQRFGGSSFDPHRAGRELKVADVVTGHFLRPAGRLGVTLEVMDIDKDEVVWSGSVEAASNDMLALRQQMTSELQKGLLPALGVSSVELSRTKPKSQEAYESYLRSQDGAYWNMARNKDAIAILEKSVALDPGYAPAWLALGLHYSDEADFGSGGEEMYNKTVAALQRAHQLDPDLLAASSWLIETRSFYEDLTPSFAQIQELARKRPRSASVHYVFSEVLRAAGALNQAARECETVRQLDAEFPTGACVVVYVHKGDFIKARQEIDRSPGDFSTMMLGQILLREGRVEEALPKLKSIPAGLGYELIRDCWPDSSTARCVATAKQSEASFRTITFSDAWYFGAGLLSFVDKKEGAIRLLKSATEHSLCVYPSVDSDRLFDKIRNSGEFRTARQEGIECEKRFAPYARIQIP